METSRSSIIIHYYPLFFWSLNQPWKPQWNPYIDHGDKVNPGEPGSASARSLPAAAGCYGCCRRSAARRWSRGLRIQQTWWFHSDSMAVPWRFHGDFMDFIWFFMIVYEFMWLYMNFIPVVPHKAVAVGCCESRMAGRRDWWTERCLRSPIFLSLFPSLPTSIPTYLPTYRSMYLSIYWSIYLSLSLSSVYLSIYLSISLSLCLSVSLSLYLSI